VLDWFHGFHLFWLSYSWVAVCLVFLSSIQECNTYKCSGLIKYAQSCGKLASIVSNRALTLFLWSAGCWCWRKSLWFDFIAKRAGLRIINMGSVWHQILISNGNLHPGASLQ
jgi:hypothetical protein